MRFEYDPIKSKANAEKHGVSLKQATQLWFVRSVEIAARSLDEPRRMLIGRLNGKFYSCIFTERNKVIRLISARRSRKEEEGLYCEKSGKDQQGRGV